MALSAVASVARVAKSSSRSLLSTDTDTDHTETSESSRGADPNLYVPQSFLFFPSCTEQSH